MLCASSAALAGDIAGTVYDSRGRPAADARLTIAGTDAATVTAADGGYRFRDVPAGAHDIAIGLDGATIQYVTVELAAQGDASRNIFLFSSSAVRHLSASTGTANGALPDEALEHAFELADEMTRDDAGGEAIAWQWRDLDA